METKRESVAEVADRCLRRIERFLGLKSGDRTLEERTEAIVVEMDGRFMDSIYLEDIAAFLNVDPGTSSFETYNTIMETLGEDEAIVLLSDPLGIPFHTGDKVALMGKDGSVGERVSTVFGVDSDEGLVYLDKDRNVFFRPSELVHVHHRENRFHAKPPIYDREGLIVVPDMIYWDHDTTEAHRVVDWDPELGTVVDSKGKAIMADQLVSYKPAYDQWGNPILRGDAVYVLPLDVAIGVVGVFATDKKISGYVLGNKDELIEVDPEQTSIVATVDERKKNAMDKAFDAEGEDDVD